MSTVSSILRNLYTVATGKNKITLGFDRRAGVMGRGPSTATSGRSNPEAEPNC